MRHASARNYMAPRHDVRQHATGDATTGPITVPMQGIMQLELLYVERFKVGKEGCILEWSLSAFHNFLVAWNSFYQ